MNGIITITIPYIPTIGIDGHKIPGEPKDFKPNIKKYGKTYKLKEIQGSQLVWFDDEQEWSELGFNAIYQWTEENYENN